MAPPLPITFGAASARGFGLFSAPVALLDEYFEYVTLLLPGNGTNGAQNNTFLDSSTNNFTITRNGNTTQGTFTPYGSNWSNYFNGTTDYLSLSDNTALEPGSSDLTWEMWINTTNSTQYATLYSRTPASFATGMWSLMMSLASSTAGDVGLYVADYNPSAPLLQTTGVNVRDGAWHHIAVVRNGSAWTLYVDGTSRATGTWAGSVVDIAGGPNIGRDQFYGRYFNGYISSLRVVKGTAVYTSAFTPPTAPLNAITNTSLLTCQSNRFIDNSTNAFTITVNGNTSVQRFSPFSPTASYAAGTIGGSGYFDGSGDYLVQNSSTNWNFLHNGSSWTIEFFLYHTSTSLIVLASTANATTQTGFSLQINGTVANDVTFAFFRGVQSSLAAFSSTGNLVINSWNHVAITFDTSGKTCTFYINGVQRGSS